jgi:hypothetical protein
MPLKHFGQDGGRGRLGMNQYGPAHVVYRFALADGREGIAIWTAPLAGDFNGDWSVNAADYTVWRNGVGTTYDQDDYLLWKNNYGASYPAGGWAASVDALSLVPEPGSAMLIGFAMAAWGLFGGRKRRGF